MYFIRNLDRLKEDSSKSQTVEYEVTIDSQIVGEFHYGGYDFFVWEFGIKKEGEDRKLILRTKENITTDKEPWNTAKKDGFFHGGGIADELVALSSLFVRRRFQLGSVVRMDDQPMLLPKTLGYIDKQIIEGKNNLSDLNEWIKLAENLDEKKHQKFILAVRLYHQALLIIEDQPDIAYLNLISSIETLSQDYDIGKISLKDIHEKLSNLVEKIKEKELKDEIKQCLIRRERLISRKFIKFILEHISEDFWRGNRGPESGQIKPEELKNRLRNIYNQRCDTLHSGMPFQPQIFSPPLNNSEIFPAHSIISIDKKWDNKDFIPYPHFFERLVNHVLKNYLKRNQVQ